MRARAGFFAGRAQNLHGTRAVHRYAARETKLRRRAYTISGTRCAARKSGDGPVGEYQADTVITGVRHERVARRVHCDALRNVKERSGAEPISGAGCAARERVDGHVWEDNSYAVVVAVRHEHATRGVYRDASGNGETRRSAEPVTESPCAAARERDYAAVVGKDDADSVAASHVHVARRVQRYAPRQAELRRSAHPINKPTHAATCERINGPVWKQNADSVVAIVSHVCLSAGAGRVGGGGGVRGGSRFLRGAQSCGGAAHLHTVPEAGCTATPRGLLYSAAAASPSVDPLNVPPAPPPASVCTI